MSKEDCRFLDKGRKSDLSDLKELTKGGYTIEQAMLVMEPLYDIRIVKSIRRMLRKGFDYEILSYYFDVDPWVIKQVDDWPLPRYWRTETSWRCCDCGQMCETSYCIRCEIEILEKEERSNVNAVQSETRKTGSATTYLALRRSWRRKNNFCKQIPKPNLPSS